MQILAVQKLFYNLNPHPVVGVFLVISTQMLGYGVAGLLRSTLVYPSAMLYPQNIPVASLMESLHKDRKVVQKKLQVFYICFGALFVWQAMPQYISKSPHGPLLWSPLTLKVPILGGISIFCLTHRDSMFITNFFGGSMANEGLGTFGISFDWSMISMS
jgi:hypothetical protein